MLNFRAAAYAGLSVIFAATGWAAAASAEGAAPNGANMATGCLTGSAADTLERANENIHIEWAEGESGAVLEAINLRPVAAEIIMSARSGEKAADRTLVLPPFARAKLFEFAGLKRDTAAAKARADWRISSYMGDPAAIVPDPDYPYRLPFRSGASSRLVQGYGGTMSHQSEPSRYALDFQLGVGEPVHAARDGVVVRAVDWFCEAGGPELISRVNMIIILHGDGSLAHYVHLDHRGVLVKEGDRVARGQHIGFVGMTGYTSGPHLHFVVMRERDLAIPIKFSGYEDRDLSRPGRFSAP